MDLRRTRLELMLKVLDVDGAVQRVKGGWEATGALGLRRRALRPHRRARAAEQDPMLATATTVPLRSSATLDDPGAAALRPLRHLHRPAHR